MSQPTATPTRIRFLKREDRKFCRCWICCARGFHKYWDPESNGAICVEDVEHVISSEDQLTNSGFARPAINV